MVQLSGNTEAGDNNYAGNADFDGNLTVSATSATANAFGVYNSTVNVGEGNTKDGKLNVAGNSVISAMAEKGDAYGVYAAGEYAQNSLTGNTEIEASAPEGKSYGVLAKKAASLSIGGDGASTAQLLLQDQKALQWHLKTAVPCQLPEQPRLKPTKPWMAAVHSATAAILK